MASEQKTPGELKPPGRWDYFRRFALWLGLLWTCQAITFLANELAHVMAVDDLSIHFKVGIGMVFLAALLAAIPDLI